MQKVIVIAKEGGIIIIEIPIKRKIVENRNAYDGHIHYFCQKSFKNLIKKFSLHPLYLGKGVQKPALLFVGTVP